SFRGRLSSPSFPSRSHPSISLLAYYIPMAQEPTPKTPAKAAEASPDEVEKFPTSRRRLRRTGRSSSKIFCARRKRCMLPKLNLATAISWRRKWVGGGGVPIQEISRELHP